jgi:hypothetical protein
LPAIGDPVVGSTATPNLGVADIRLPESSGGKQRRDMPLAIAGTGYGLIGILVIILLVVLIMNFARRA